MYTPKTASCTPRKRDGHAQRQQQEDWGEQQGEAQGDEADFEPALLDRAAREQVLEAEVVQVQALEREQREEQPALLAGDQADQAAGFRGIFRGTRWCRRRCRGLVDAVGVAGGGGCGLESHQS